MKLNTVHGLQQAEGVLTRFDPLDIGSLPESIVDRTHELFGPNISPQDSVLKILSDVRDQGDKAVFHYAELLDETTLISAEVSQEDRQIARSALSDHLIESLHQVLVAITTPMNAHPSLSNVSAVCSSSL